MLCVVVLGLYSANPVANRLLAAFIGLETLHLFLHYFILTDHSVSPAVMRLVFNARILAGPALYLYACAITRHWFRWRAQRLFHLWVVLPPLAMSLFLFPGEQAVYTYNFDEGATERSLSWRWTAMSIYHSVVIIGYAAFALRQLSRHRLRLEHALSAVEDDVNLHWLRCLIIGLITAQGIHMGLNVLALTDLVGTLAPARFLNTLTTIVMVYLIALGGLRQPVVFTSTVRAALAGVGDNGNGGGTARRDKYARSGLGETRRREIWKELQQLLRSARVHLDPDLDLPGLAQRLQIRPQELSETINTEYQGTFYELINYHRIEAAKQLLEQPGPGRRKMLDIALSVGFNSLSTFYSHFKKYTGITPTEYRARSQRRSGIPA